MKRASSEEVAAADHEHSAAELVVERLRATPLFGGLPEDLLHRLVVVSDILDFQPDDVLIREGDVADAIFVILAGEFQVTKRSGTADVRLDRQGPGELMGEIAALEGGPRLATVKAATEAEVLRVPVSAMRDFLAAGPDVALGIIKTAVSRLRGMEAALRERQKLAGLGTLAAGLAHELNNPAAAALRTVRALEQVIAARESAPQGAALPTPAAEGQLLGALERSDRIDAAMAVVGDAELAADLVDAGWTAAELTEFPKEKIARLAANASVRQLVGELAMAVERISEIVGAVKGYAYLDQAPVQRVNITIGLEQTIVILSHQIKEGVVVERSYSDDLPEIEVFGSELNQVWTNLMENAIHAMDGDGVLTITAQREAEGVKVTICDTGGGIRDDVRARMFEPFFTTKPPGHGTGLGLHMSHNVVTRHGGSIEVDSVPGRTCFQVSLPGHIPR